MTRIRRAPAMLVTAALTLGAGFLLGQARPQAAAEPALFVMMYTPGPAWDTTLAPNAQRHFDVHSANLARLRRDSVIVAGGRFGPWGLILVEAEDEAGARALFEPDSSLVSGTFRAELHPWTTIYDGFVPRR